MADNANGLTAYSYVQKGLAACWDGIDNAGSGSHDSSVRTWKDLTGNGYDGILSDIVSWEDNCWSTAVSGRPVKLPNSFSYLTAARTFTVDCAFSPSRAEKSASARETVFGQYDGSYNGTFNIEHNHNNHPAGCLRFYMNKGQIDKYSTGVVLANQNATVALTVTPAKQVLYIDGASDTVSTTSLSTLYSSKDTYIGGETSRESFGFRGRYYGCRFYDRALTAEEVAVNHAVDAIRYWGASPNDFTLSGGYCFDAEGELLIDVTANVTDGGGKVCVGTGGDASDAISATINQNGTESVTFTAVPDEGYEFATWVLEDGAMLDEGSSLTDPTISIYAKWPLAVTATFREKGKLTAYSYVQKGLVACWDGIDNAGTGEHDEETRVWKDLTGNGYNGTLGSDVTWAENGWQNEANEKPVSLGYGFSTVTEPCNFTIDFTVTPSRAPCREIFFGQFGWDYGSINLERKANGRLRCYYNYDEVDFESTQAIAANETASFTVTTTPGKQAVWKNGVKDVEQTDKAISAMSGGKPTYIGADGTGNSNRKSFNFHGTYHGCRVYDRVLTDAEIAVNHAVDAIRYRGASAGSFTLSGGYSFNNSGNLLIDLTATASAGGKVCSGTADVAAATAVATISQDGTVSAAFTAVPDNGYEFVAWDVENGGTIIGGSTSDATINISARWPLVLTAVFRPARAAFPATTVADYVKDGLVMWFDGVDNAGAGRHDGAAAAWADLSGNGNDAVAVGPGLGWADNSCTNAIDGKQTGEAGLFRLNGAVAPVIANRTFTLEMAIRPGFVKNRKVLFGSYDGASGFNLEENDSGMFRVFYNNTPNVVTTVPMVKDEEAVFSVVSTADGVAVYKNGVPVYRYEGAIDAKGTIAALEDSVYYLGGERQREGFTYRGAIYSFRLYSRALTSAEVLRNTRLDQQRLLANTTLWSDATGGSWMDSASWSGGLPNTLAPAIATLAGADVRMGLAQTAPNTANVTLANPDGTSVLTLASGATLPVPDNSLAIGGGGELRVETGGTLALDVTGNNPTPRLTVADGGKLTVDGGTVKLTKSPVSINVFGSEGRTGTLEIVSGRMETTVSNTGQDGVAVLKGGLLRMTGGNLTLNRTGSYNNGGNLVDDGGAVDLSGDAALIAHKTGITIGSGTFRMADASHIDFLTDTGKDDTVYRVLLQPGVGRETVMTVDDSATITPDPLSGQMQFFVGYQNAGSRTILNWNSTQTLKALRTFAVGFVKGYGELNISRGQIIGGYNGFRVAQNYANPSADACVTGVVNVIGGSVRNIDTENDSSTFQGLIIGSGGCVKIANPGYFWGTLNLYDGGAVTNSSEYFGIGIGYAEGVLNQHGGEVIHNNSSNNEFVIGAWGGKGSMVMDGGRAWSKRDVYVGGATTNNLYYKRWKLYTQCPVDNHCATGLLRVAAGRFDTAGSIWVSQDGQGTLEIGPAGQVSANNVILTNTVAELTGTVDLAAKLAFVLDEDGAGLLTVTNALTIGQGVTMEVDATERKGRGGNIPLIRFGESEGEFSAITVKGGGTVKKLTVDGMSGYWYQFSPGTIITIL